MRPAGKSMRPRSSVAGLSSIPNTEAFLARVFAAIPDGEEQADTRAFRKLLKLDMLSVWNAGMARVVQLEAAHRVLCLTRCGPDIRVAFQLLRIEITRQCRIPAPTEKGLRWKKRQIKFQYRPIEPIEQAIALDEKWLKDAKFIRPFCELGSPSFKQRLTKHGSIPRDVRGEFEK